MSSLINGDKLLLLLKFYKYLEINFSPTSKYLYILSGLIFMMKKREFIFIGLFISMVGLILIIKNLSLTGAVISEIVINSKIYFLPIVLFIGGILIATSSDKLQELLEKKEKEHPSHSLEGRVQTEDERKHFNGRFSGDVPWYQRIGKSRVEQVEQNTGKYVEPLLDNYSFYEKSPGKLRLEIEGHAKVIPLLRKKILDAKKKMDSLSDSGEIHDYYKAIRDYHTSAVALKEALSKSGLDMSRKAEERYMRLAVNSANKVIPIESQRLREDVINNNFAFSYSLDTPISERQDLLKNLKKYFSPNQEIPSMDELERLHFEKGKTVSISKFTRDNVFFHSFPLKDHANPNNRNAEYNPETTPKSFLDYITENRPMLSVGSTPSDSQENRIVRLAGILLEDGRIYDASSTSFHGSVRPRSKLRIRGSSGPDDRFPIETRAYRATKGRGDINSMIHNEFIVGDYKIRGLYFNPARILGMADKIIISEIASEAIERGLRLYEATEKGFIEVDPKKYV